MGFEPTVRCRITGFQDRLLKPLGHLSLSAFPVTKLLYHINPALSRAFVKILRVSVFETDTRFSLRSPSRLTFSPPYCIIIPTKHERRQRDDLDTPAGISGVCRGDGDGLPYETRPALLAGETAERKEQGPRVDRVGMAAVYLSPLSGGERLRLCYRLRQSDTDMGRLRPCGVHHPEASEEGATGALCHRVNRGGAHRLLSDLGLDIRSHGTADGVPF